ncbi:hypothetical protein BC937DRAFT_93588 [Endogone sp. FLAS-F59071]|nr:hypothetical protein BC937DRAFT_93588 [Endogone sp. FLAS-F59071]|eukprot:RUS14588.1 hypothetical protein BC937DRAFT_93588 [Endogone sp. FLAS-F59071]
MSKINNISWTLGTSFFIFDVILCKICRKCLRCPISRRFLDDIVHVRQFTARAVEARENESTQVRKMKDENTAFACDLEIAAFWWLRRNAYRTCQAFLNALFVLKTNCSLALMYIIKKCCASSALSPLSSLSRSLSFFTPFIFCYNF